MNKIFQNIYLSFTICYFSRLPIYVFTSRRLKSFTFIMDIKLPKKLRSESPLSKHVKKTMSIHRIQNKVNRSFKNCQNLFLLWGLLWFVKTTKIDNPVKLCNFILYLLLSEEVSGLWYKLRLNTVNINWYIFGIRNAVHTPLKYSLLILLNAIVIIIFYTSNLNLFYNLMIDLNKKLCVHLFFCWESLYHGQ